MDQNQLFEDKVCITEVELKGDVVIFTLDEIIKGFIFSHHKIDKVHMETKRVNPKIVQLLRANSNKIVLKDRINVKLAAHNLGPTTISAQAPRR